MSKLIAYYFLQTALTIPTPTVCFISLMANLPSGGYSEKVSTTIGLDGTKLTIAESPVLIEAGSSWEALPVLLSMSWRIFSNLQAT